MKWIKTYESIKTELQKKYEDLLDKFEKLTDSINIEEVMDRFLSLEDLLGSELRDVNFFIKPYFKKEDEFGNTIKFSMTNYLYDIESYKELKSIYDNILIENISVDVYCQLNITFSTDKYIKTKKEIEDEISEINSILNSMKYDLEIKKEVTTSVTHIIFNVIKSEVDPSFIVEEPDYYNLLPTPFIKDFTEFVVKYGVSDSDRLNFANKIKKLI